MITDPKRLAQLIAQRERSRCTTRRWQLLKQINGVCLMCTHAAEDDQAHCKSCQKKRRNAYRLRVGIPLDAPIGTRRSKIAQA